MSQESPSIILRNFKERLKGFGVKNPEVVDSLGCKKKKRVYRQIKYVQTCMDIPIVKGNMISNRVNKCRNLIAKFKEDYSLDIKIDGRVLAAI